MYECNKCYHQFSGTPDSLACCNVCENGDLFMGVQEVRRKIMMLSDKRTPTCPHCGMAKLETDDIIDSWERTEKDGSKRMVEQTIGFCPNCNHTFDYLQIFTYDPIQYEDLEDITEEEEEEEDE